MSIHDAHDDPGTPSKRPPKRTAREVLLGEHTIWSPGVPDRAAWGGLRVVPCVLLDPRFRVRALDAYKGPRSVGGGAAGVDAVWAWTRPGDLRPLTWYGTKLIADVEDTNDATGTGWTGALTEDEHAHELASVCQGVTSHGYVLADCRRALSVFAEHGCVAVPQVYKRDPTIPAHTFVRRCVQHYKALGFRDVAPLLGVAVVERKGLAWLQGWAEACAGEGCNFHLYAYGAIVEGAPTLQRWVRSLADRSGVGSGAPVPALPGTREYTGPDAVADVEGET